MQIMENKLPTNLKDLGYQEMFDMARGFIKKGKIETAAHVVRQMVKRWPERVLNSRKRAETTQGGDSHE